MPSRSANFIARTASRIATLFGPRLMRSLARFNRHVTNPLQRLWAPRLRYMAVIEHRGRKSGQVYRTPVMAIIENSTMAVVLNYGVESDWVRNVLAAGSATVVNRGTRFRLENPRIEAGEPSVLHAALTPLPTA